MTAGSTAGHPRLDDLTTWDADWSGLRVVVAGLGLSGFSAADTLAELGADVVVVDGRDSPENRARADTLRIVGVREVLLGEDHARSLPDVGGSPAELVVTSPGWRPDQPLLAAAADAGVPVWGDVELAWRVRERAGRKTADWLVVTGTNGKTTTVGMVESMLLAAGLRAVACGNVGTPILDAIRDPEGWDVIAVELSSFQLHWTHHIEPAASAVLNVAEDHVDWHGSFAAYCADKARIYEHTREACIFNEAQPETMRMVEQADVQEGCRAVSFTTDTPGLSMVGVVDGILVDRAFLDERAHQALELGHLEDLGPIAPRHQVANALAAAALVRAIGVPPEAVRDGLRAYRPGEHRIQLVAKADDVLWINDSKATNPHAADASLAAFTDVVWIAGGLPKGVTYDDLVSRHAHRLRAVVLIGADPSELAGAVQRHAPDVPVLSTAVRDTGGDPSDGHRAMDAAVREADAVARPGDVVLMAPAAASMDQFTSYADRGNAFIDAVARLMEHKGLSS
ncbi:MULTISPECIES: UDP-N-acetylmuramoyl-L-alanine--D-glutamate ligase [Micrococcaceae]|uniref:UDP-N-acetylmuramoyl-L-alanine--D-glutamate ligase n=1 Tax=Micrococcaceae TaxID=1268 RepID=UPI00160D99A8|nr:MULTISPECIES: UDP-N-acetylmuramoyl-L-alanine--D-glutamate ligase [Micrococcaceae]MBB5749190.1 UDP-N-acetylmuramoylalanine--D-glutamate ligase [Micrococcus sp. TA1]HRO29389.1 UDP-N-acetylmuramoyl-L-alanine--D-glutamate ligase [Citricoccus sp.]HRO93008.1 UDP-N-acetylmuramoyl-L-alanine--D-glutamate ligase [Citricoccus sp.]